MRSFKVNAALVGANSILAMLVAACGSSTSTTSTPSAPPGYNFTYNYSTPANTSATITYGEYEAVDTLNPILATSEVDVKNINEVLDGCVVQLPDLTLGLAGWKADQCAEVPTVANGDESSDGTSTTVKIDPNAKWSDGTPETADDYLFYGHLLIDPNVGGAPPPYNYIKSLTYVDPQTFKITWTQSFGPYLSALWSPLPAHSFPQAWNMTTHTYTSPPGTLLQSAGFNFGFPSDGPYTLQSHSANSEVYVKNPSFHSNFFKGPNASEIVFKSEGDVNTTIEAFKTGTLLQADDFIVTNVAAFNGAGIPQSEQVTSPNISFEHIDFNLRPQALNAKDPNNTSKASIFSGTNGQLVRKAFTEAFNLCSAFLAILNDSNCTDPNLHTAENTAPPAPDYDPTVTLPAYNPSQAATDLTTAGYPNCKYSNGQTVVLHIATTSGNPTRLAFVSLAAQEWGLNLGCTVKVDTFPAATFFASFTNNGILYGGAWDISLFAYVNGAECSLNDITYLSNNIPSATNPFGGNDSGLTDPQIDQMVNQALQTTDTAARNTICKNLQKYMSSQNFNIPLYIRANYTLVSPTLANYKLDPVSVGNTWNVADWGLTQ